VSARACCNLGATNMLDAAPSQDEIAQKETGNKSIEG
jgi:hypothetical protein